VAVLPGGLLVTALHVVDRALEITVRLADGRELPAELLGGDPASDLALLRVAAELPAIALAPPPALGSPVCAVGNQFGLGLSVTCGVVSALNRSGTGFNPIEDFVQTDATVNPGASGGALLDSQGRLVGVLSAIFAKESDASIGVNFAASTPLVMRVAEDLARLGQVVRGQPGFRLGELEPAERARLVGVRVLGLRPGGPAAKAGIEPGDILTAVDGRPVRKVSGAIAAIHLKRPGESLILDLSRDGRRFAATLVLGR
jgi:S1-C subfamily serine protease